MLSVDNGPGHMLDDGDFISYTKMYLYSIKKTSDVIYHYDLFSEMDSRVCSCIFISLPLRPVTSFLINTCTHIQCSSLAKISQ